VSTDRHRTHLGSAGIALFVTLLWSSSWILIRWGLDEQALRPITFAALRYGLASLIMIGFVLSRPGRRRQIAELDRSAMARIIVLGIVFYAVTQGAVFVALDSQPAATTNLMLALTPLFVAVLAGRSLRERTSARQLFGTVLVAVGAWMYFTGGLGATVAGMAAAVVALGANVAGSLLGRHVNRPADVSPTVVTAVSMTVGAFILTVVGVAVEGFPTVSATAWLIIAWLSIVNTAFAFTLWNLSLRGLSAVESAGINNTMLIQITILAWIFLDERPGLVGIAGILLVSIGVLLTQAAAVPNTRSARSRIRSR
jgi:drug/metabolite transporter (DMT)-like permease